MEYVAVLAVVVAFAWWSMQHRGRSRSDARRSTDRPRRAATHAPTVDVRGEPPAERRAEARVYGDTPISLTGERPRQTSAQCWIPPGEPHTVGEHHIPGGMLYIGHGLRSVCSEWSLEPALVDPHLPTLDASPDGSMGYWPSYSAISPAHRHAHLAWLAGGRRDPDVEMGHVFLHFYGLERRALVDADDDPVARAEIPAIRDEVERLLGIYAGSRSFRGYASGFLEILEARDAGPDVAAIHGDPGERFSHHALQRTLAACALTGRPLPARWALAWLRHDPRTSLRTPARRCAEEFDALFLVRYAERHGEGLALRPCKRTLTVEYRPASASLSAVQVRTGLPDIAALVGPHRRLQELAANCDDDLGAFSRFVGRRPDERGSPAALALMPPDLAVRSGAPTIDAVRQALDRALGPARGGVFETADLIGPWADGPIDQLTKRRSTPLLQLFGHAGFGIEPDVRFGGPPLGKTDRVCAFRLDECSLESASNEYSAAALLLQLAVSVSAADGDLSRAEEEHLRDHLAGSLHLDRAERVRLDAHLQWLLAAPPGLAGVRKRVQALSPGERRHAVHLMLGVAWADGEIDPPEVKMLQRLYKLLDLDAEAVHQDLHDARHHGRGGEPVRVQRRTAAPEGYAIPERPQLDTDQQPDSAELDEAAIRDKLHQTAAVSSLLASIFAEDEPAEAESPSAPGSGDQGLSVEIGQLLQRLGDRASWSREEYECAAQELGLMPDGALESLNDLAFERCDEPLCEGDDPIEINQDIFRELTA